MKKILIMFMSLLLFCGCTLHKKTSDNTPLDILTLFQSQSNAQNKLWVATFQLAFNDIKENIVKKDIYLDNEKPTSDLIGLNQNLFSKEMLNDASYYTSWGETSFEAKEKIKKDIKEKFDTTSDILDFMNWTKEKGKYYAYAMLKKDFQFLSEFDKLDKASFNKSSEKYTYFGINEKSKKEKRKAANVLFYNNDNDYAVQLRTKEGDNILLYRTEDNRDFQKIYEKMLKNSNDYKGNTSLADNDTLKVPNLKIKDTRKYPELCNKTIIGTDFYFSDAIETIDLVLDEKGGKIKSEAAITLRTCSLEPQIKPEKPRHFNFDKTYVMFFIDSGKDNPYFAIRIKDLKNMQ